MPGARCVQTPPSRPAGSEGAGWGREPRRPAGGVVGGRQHVGAVMSVPGPWPATGGLPHSLVTQSGQHGAWRGPWLGHAGLGGRVALLGPPRRRHRDCRPVPGAGSPRRGVGSAGPPEASPLGGCACRRSHPSGRASPWPLCRRTPSRRMTGHPPTSFHLNRLFQDWTSNYSSISRGLGLV